jgi:hypothetical protein
MAILNILLERAAPSQTARQFFTDIEPLYPSSRVCGLFDRHGRATEITEASFSSELSRGPHRPWNVESGSSKSRWLPSTGLTISVGSIFPVSSLRSI